MPGQACSRKAFRASFTLGSLLCIPHREKGAQEAEGRHGGALESRRSAQKRDRSVWSGPSRVYGPPSGSASSAPAAPRGAAEPLAPSFAGRPVPPLSIIRRPSPGTVQASVHDLAHLFPPDGVEEHRPAQAVQISVRFHIVISADPLPPRSPGRHAVQDAQGDLPVRHEVA